MWTAFIWGLMDSINLLCKRFICKGYFLSLHFWLKILRGRNLFWIKHVCSLFIPLSHPFFSISVFHSFHLLSDFILFLYHVPFIIEFYLSLLNFINSEPIPVPFPLRNYSLNHFLRLFKVLNYQSRWWNLINLDRVHALFDFLYKFVVLNKILTY